MDTTREIRAMTMAAFPCPPLPVERGSSSHDLIAFLIDVAARRNMPAENTRRKELQEQITAAYLEELVNSEPFDAMTKFTRNYALSYTPNAHDIRFNPFDTMCPMLHEQVCSWLAAQHILDGDASASGFSFSHLPPAKLLEACADVILKRKAKGPSRSCPGEE